MQLMHALYRNKTNTKFKALLAYIRRTNSPQKPGSNVDGMIQKRPLKSLTRVKTLLAGWNDPDGIFSMKSCIRYLLFKSVYNGKV